MNRAHSVASALLVCVLSGLGLSSANAQDIYKWTDAGGKVHYGDRAAAPASSKPVKVSIAAPSRPAADPASATSAPPLPPSLPHSDVRKTAVPVDPSRVGPQCQSLIGKIAAAPAGKNWESLYRQFDRACPGIAYECVEYQSTPQNNQCIWVERSGRQVLNRNRYP